MLKLYRILGNNPVSGDVGVEIEVEFRDSTIPSLSAIPAGWVNKSDGSLRFVGREYVFSKPVNLDLAESRINKLCEVLNNERYSLIKDSPRAGVHVHLNVCEYRFNEYFTAVLAYWLLEDLLIKYCGEETRAGNLYCMRVSDSENLVYSLVNAFSTNNLLRQPVWGQRYFSQNISPLRSKMSVEYRGMRGTTDPGVIIPWVRGLYSLHKKAKEYKTPDRFFTWYETEVLSNPDNVLSALFEESFVETLKTYEDYGDLMRTNLDLLDQLAFVHDWEAWQNKYEESTGLIMIGASPTTVTYDPDY